MIEGAASQQNERPHYLNNTAAVSTLGARVSSWVAGVARDRHDDRML
jgi:hypothetical protein